MRNQLGEDQLRSMVTVRQMRDLLAPNTNLSSGRFKYHPLYLPLHERSEASSDRSVLSVPMPFVLPREPQTETAHMLRPIARLCRGNPVPEGRWEYEWYYFELLDREDKLHPLCWISTEVLQTYFPDDLPLGPPIGDATPPGRWPRQLRVMDHLPQSQAWPEAQQDIYGEWQDWFVRTWRKHESEWRENGTLFTRAISPWTRMIGYEPELAALMARTQDTGWDAESKLPLWLTNWKAGYSGFYWRMVPLYGIEDAGIVWRQMKRESFITSVLNIAAGPHQEPERWAWLEERFRHPFRRMSPYDFYIRYREQRVVELSNQGYKLDEIAAHLMDEGFFPFNRKGPTKPKRLSAKEKEEMIPLARRVVVRIRTRLIREGVVEPRKRGRPRKGEAPLEPRPSAGGRDRG